MGWAKIKKACIFFGTVHEYCRKVCPADGKNCNKCKRPNHFATVCKQNLNASNIGPYKNKPNKCGRPNKYGKKGQVNMVGHSDETDPENEFFKIETVNLTKPRVGPSDKDTLAIKKQWITELLFINKNKAHSIKYQLDTGASCSIIRKNDLLRLTKNGVESSVSVA